MTEHLFIIDYELTVDGEKPVKKTNPVSGYDIHYALEKLMIREKRLHQNKDVTIKVIMYDYE